MEKPPSRKRTRAQAGITTLYPPYKRNIFINNNDVNFFSSFLFAQTTTEELCSTVTSDESPTSCCSSNESVNFNENRKLSDPTVEVESTQVETTTCDYGEQIIRRREMSQLSEVRPNSPEVDSTEKKPEKNKPTESELDEFFAVAEKDIQKRFQDKYNFDIVKDIPLEGRYEWDKLKP